MATTMVRPWLGMAGLLLGLLLAACSDKPPQVPQATAEAPVVASAQDPALLAALQQLLDKHRRIIVLLADEQDQSASDRATSIAVGQQLFHQALEQRRSVADGFAALLDSGRPERMAVLAALLDYIESDPGLYDADRLAFVEVLRDLHHRLTADSSLPAVKLRQRVEEDLAALAEVERTYNAELTHIFSRFQRPRAIELKREKWQDYQAYLLTRYSRTAILRDFGVVEPYPMAMDDGQRELFGRSLPERTVVLSFDDGPHRAHTEEIIAILKRYDVPAVFFQVGRNLGTVGEDGQARLGPMAAISRQLSAEGYTLGNHSFSHAQLSRSQGKDLQHQVMAADTLLRQVDQRRAPLFRFPYGARNAEGMQLLAEAGLKSIMWNIDSMDWADPVPESIVQRVLEQVEREKRGIVLFHDIHERTVKALPKILDRLIADGYQFAGWNGREFSVSRARAAASAEATVTTAYANSWAIVIGITTMRTGQRSNMPGMTPVPLPAP